MIERELRVDELVGGHRDELLARVVDFVTDCMPIIRAATNNLPPVGPGGEGRIVEMDGRYLVRIPQSATVVREIDVTDDMLGWLRRQDQRLREAGGSHFLCCVMGFVVGVIDQEMSVAEGRLIDFLAAHKVPNPQVAAGNVLVRHRASSGPMALVREIVEEVWCHGQLERRGVGQPGCHGGLDR